MSKCKDLTGRKFGKLTVLKISHRGKSYRYYLLCLCDCGKTKVIARDSLVRGFTKSCGCEIAKSLRRRFYKGTKDISGRYFCSLKNGAKIRKIDFNITIKYIQELLEKQNYRCIISGVEIYGDQTNNKRTASLDRIDSKKGYIEGNVQWVHDNINIMKWDFDQNKFIEKCIEIAKYQSNKNEKYKLQLFDQKDAPISDYGSGTISTSYNYSI